MNRMHWIGGVLAASLTLGGLLMGVGCERPPEEKPPRSSPPPTSEQPPSGARPTPSPDQPGLPDRPQ